MNYTEKFKKLLRDQDGLIYIDELKEELEELFEEADKQIRELKNDYSELEDAMIEQQEEYNNSDNLFDLDELDIELKNYNDNERLQKFLEYLRKNPGKPA